MLERANKDWILAIYDKLKKLNFILKGVAEEFDDYDYDDMCMCLCMCMCTCM